jgi:hypothetical protein
LRASRAFRMVIVSRARCRTALKAELAMVKQRPAQDVSGIPAQRIDGFSSAFARQLSSKHVKVRVIGGPLSDGVNGSIGFIWVVLIVVMGHQVRRVPAQFRRLSLELPLQLSHLRRKRKVAACSSEALSLAAIAAMISALNG